jgi:predicted nuclease of predicted toxin-antitoxin system
MNLLADESIDQPIVVALRQDGHDVVYIAELSPSISDDEVLDRANHGGAVLLTADKDFGELVFRQGRAHTGVVLIRLAGLVPQTKAQTVCHAISEHGPEFVGSFSVISAGLVRIRHSP